LLPERRQLVTLLKGFAENGLAILASTRQNLPMDDIPRQLAALHVETQESRYQFLKAELLTCFNAIGFGTTEMELGNREVAESEVRSAEKGYATILRFLPGMDSEELRNEIKAALPRLREVVDALRNKLGLPK
jgi:hypothetical protein